MFLRSTYPAFLWAAVILILCALPGSSFPKLTFLDWLRPDKVVHLIMFGALCFLLIKGFTQQNTFHPLSLYPKMYAALLSIIYGIVIELLQEYIFIWRSGEFFDVVADAFGALIGLWVYNYWIKKKLAHS
jgi:glycopeptide antibiotics resistance protein